MANSKALFAGGCFWGVQHYFDQVPGVVKTTAGYTGGHTKNPTYDDVHSRTTGHDESVLIEFDPKKVSYRTLVRHFFKIHNPTQLNRQGPDIGDEYRSAIFFFGDGQKMIAEAERKAAQRDYKEPIVTEITKAGAFYRAEEYHQKFAEKTGIGVCPVPYKPLK